MGSILAASVAMVSVATPSVMRPAMVAVVTMVAIPSMAVRICVLAVMPRFVDITPLPRVLHEPCITFDSVSFVGSQMGGQMHTCVSAGIGLRHVAIM